MKPSIQLGLGDAEGFGGEIDDDSSALEEKAHLGQLLSDETPKSRRGDHQGLDPFWNLPREGGRLTHVEAGFIEVKIERADSCRSGVLNRGGRGGRTGP